MNLWMQLAEVRRALDLVLNDISQLFVNMRFGYIFTWNVFDEIYLIGTYIITTHDYLFIYKNAVARHYIHVSFDNTENWRHTLHTSFFLNLIKELITAQVFKQINMYIKQGIINTTNRTINDLYLMVESYALLFLKFDDARLERFWEIQNIQS